MLATAVLLATTSRAEAVPARQSLVNLPFRIDQWAGRREADFEPEIMALLGVDDYIIRSYRRRDGASLGLYVGYYFSQRQGDTIHSPMNCLPGAGWQPLEQGRAVIPVRTSADASSRELSADVNRVVIGKGLDRQLVFYWYQSRGRVVASEYWGKIYTVLDAVRYNRTDAALVRVVAPIGDGGAIEKVDAATEQFVQSLFPLLAAHLPE